MNYLSRSSSLMAPDIAPLNSQKRLETSQQARLSGIPGIRVGSSTIGFQMAAPSTASKRQQAAFYSGGDTEEDDNNSSVNLNDKYRKRGGAG